MVQEGSVQCGAPTHCGAQVICAAQASTMIVTGGRKFGRHAWRLAATAVWFLALHCNTVLPSNMEHKSALWDPHPRWPQQVSS